MTIAEQHASSLFSPGSAGARGPVTRARLARTGVVYAILWLIGLTPVILHAAPGWRAAGLGLWAPGAGFVAGGGWESLLFPLTLGLFAVSLVAWFWAGMVIAPVTVWLGAAAVAGLITPATPWPMSHTTVGLALVAFAGLAWNNGRKRRAANRAAFTARAQFLPQSLAEVRAHAAEVPEPGSREMSLEQLGSLRYALDRALQPIAAFDGFDIIDQFQPAALRYQINYLGFALSLAQGGYTPAFSGYLGQAQRNLIEKYLLRKVWGYWVWESCWGHLNFTNHDPAARDNIMLTGWFGMQVGAYMLNSGDRRYEAPGSLTFHLNARTAYVHDFHTIIGSVVDNYVRDSKAFCLYPCEPNWIYPICNHYGMTSLASHDALFGTDYVARFLPTWQAKLDSEFTDESGSIIGLRSQLTGIEFPFPSSEAGYANFADCFAPERARRLWAVARREIAPAVAPGADGQPRLHLPGRGLDAGNYTLNHTASFGTIMWGAREFGDEDLALAAQRALDQDCGLDTSGGARRYLKGSNLANVNAVLGALSGVGDFRRTFVEGPPKTALSGPELKEADYPAVLVAKAFSHGDDLELVLHPGAAPGVQTLTIGRLRPGAEYALTGAKAATVTADLAGEARISVSLKGRTEVTLRAA